MNANITESGSSASPAAPSRLWWWFVLAFVVQLAAWTATANVLLNLDETVTRE